MKDILAMLSEWNEKIKTLPPMPTGIRMHHAVPWGRSFRQWDTKDRLWIWVNKGWLLGEIKQIEAPPPEATILSPHITGIAVYDG